MNDAQVREGRADERKRARKGDWVQVHSIVLAAGERAPNVPGDTARVPLELRVKGFLQDDARIGEQVSITTATGRTVTGTLVAINPAYPHDFGEPVPELLTVGAELRRFLEGMAP